MGSLTLVFGAVLVLVGLVSYLASASGSWTALIPSIFGAILAVLGSLALLPTLRKHAMHAAAAVALLGLVGALMRAVPGLVRVLQQEGQISPLALASQWIMALLLAVFIALCIRSFINARRNRDATNAAAGA